VARRLGVLLAALARGLPPRYTASDRLQSFPTETGQRLLVELAGSKAALSALLVGMGEPASLDQTDGLRVTPTSGEIVQFRPRAMRRSCVATARRQHRHELKGIATDIGHAR